MAISTLERHRGITPERIVHAAALTVSTLIISLGITYGYIKYTGNLVSPEPVSASAAILIPEKNVPTITATVTPTATSTRKFVSPTPIKTPDLKPVTKATVVATKTKTLPSKTPVPVLVPCEYTRDSNNLPRLSINGGGECSWNWTSAVGDRPYNVWPADVLADKEIAKATNTGCPPDYRDGSHFCWDGGKIVGGPVRIRPVKEGKLTIESVGGQPIPATGGGKDCYGEILPSGAWIWWCAPKQSP